MHTINSPVTNFTICVFEDRVVADNEFFKIQEIIHFKHDKMKAIACVAELMNFRIEDALKDISK